MGRSRGQAIGLAAVAMVAVVGALAFVVDTGFFLEGRRELQNAADSAALAGIVFLPDCPDSSPGGKCTANNAQDSASQYVAANGPIVRQLCGHPSISVAPGATAAPGTYTGYDGNSFYYTFTVSLSCNPGFSFGRILVGLLQEQIAASATAVSGSLGEISCSAPLDVVAYSFGTDANNYGYTPGLGNIPGVAGQTNYGLGNPNFDLINNVGNYTADSG
ncbi:MAG: Tad domain-containing protein, partial [Chloroflexi bacterium]|nr:Tad domain-containing protein [Chloroflexota bacterium]